MESERFSERDFRRFLKRSTERVLESERSLERFSERDFRWDRESLDRDLELFRRELEWDLERFLERFLDLERSLEHFSRQDFND